jgi:hypothetical protein
VAAKGSDSLTMVSRAPVTHSLHQHLWNLKIGRETVPAVNATAEEIGCDKVIVYERFVNDKGSCRISNAATSLMQLKVLAREYTRHVMKNFVVLNKIKPKVSHLERFETKSGN